ncbi:MAG: hypothetical protein GX490_06305 [Bacilli bacterium]|nr:hypothetical protein [Bacilli bacterium]
MSEKKGGLKKLLITVVAGTMLLGVGTTFLIKGPEIVDEIENVFVPGENTQSENTQNKKVETPKNLKFENNILSWDAVPNAVRYEVVKRYREHNVSFTYETFLPMFEMDSYYGGAQDGDHVDFTVVAIDAKYKRSEPATYTIVIENRNEKIYDEIIDNLNVFAAYTLRDRRLSIGGRYGIYKVEYYSIRKDEKNLYVLVSGDVIGSTDKVFVRVKVNCENCRNPLPESVNRLTDFEEVTWFLRKGDVITVEELYTISDRNVFEGIKLADNGVIADYINNGYIVEAQKTAISNLTQDEDNYIFDVFGVYKATKNGVEEYFEAKHTVTVAKENVQGEDFIEYFIETGDGEVIENDSEIYNTNIDKFLQQSLKERQRRQELTQEQ